MRIECVCKLAYGGNWGAAAASFWFTHRAIPHASRTVNSLPSKGSQVRPRNSLLRRSVSAAVSTTVRAGSSRLVKNTFYFRQTVSVGFPLRFRARGIDNHTDEHNYCTSTISVVYYIAVPHSFHQRYPVTLALVQIHSGARIMSC
jgi:hypothetical protein